MEFKLYIQLSSIINHPRSVMHEHFIAELEIKFHIYEYSYLPYPLLGITLHHQTRPENTR